jgi:uncharacterized alkaline shock family protein YloU
VLYGLDLNAVADRLRDRVAETLALHTDLAVTAVDVTVDDVWLPGDGGTGPDGGPDTSRGTASRGTEEARR